MECRRGLARRILSARLSVRLSVRPSVTREDCDKTVKTRFPDLYTIRKNIYPSFLRRRMVGGGDPFYLKFWVGSTGPR